MSQSMRKKKEQRFYHPGAATLEANAISHGPLGDIHDPTNHGIQHALNHELKMLG